MIDANLPTSRLIVATLLFAGGCGGSESKVESTEPSCSLPIAEAGSSLNAPVGASITLNGNGSEWCEDFGAHEVTFTWGFERVPADSSVTEAALSENLTSTANRPTFLPDLPGEYVISLRINDPSNASDPDYLVVTVSSDDLAPLANCGDDRYGRVGIATRLDGGASTDPEGARLNFNWGVSSTPECSRLTTSNIFDQGTATPSIIPDCQGLYVMSLLVDDGIQWSPVDYCTIDVRSDNRAPVAEAGSGGALPPCTVNPFTLGGWESHDPDGDSLTYSWSVVSAPTGADAALYGFDDPTRVDPQFTWDVAGEWTFQLQVNDGSQTSSPDIVTYLIGSEDDNNSPTANAGGDQTVLVEANCSTSSYVWTCDDCAQTTYPLDGTGSSDPDGDTLNYNWSIEGDPLEWVSSTSAVANIILPAGPAVYDVDTTVEYDVMLNVNDCSLDDSDRITLTHICRGIYVLPEIP